MAPAPCKQRGTYWCQEQGSTSAGDIRKEVLHWRRHSAMAPAPRSFNQQRGTLCRALHQQQVIASAAVDTIYKPYGTRALTSSDDMALTAAGSVVGRCSVWAPPTRQAE
jgi:hypothetical protein